MKKILALCMTAILCLCCLASCSSAHKENKWFSEEKLTQCLVGDLPTIEKDYVNHNGEDIYVSFTSKEREAYVAEVFEYLKSQNFKYLGTRGEQANTLAGSFTTYYFKPATELSEFYVGSSYKFVYSDGTLDEGGDPIFCILTIYDYEAKHLEYGTKNFAYNTLITLRYKSEAPLSGRYALNEEECVHTKGDWEHNEYGHWQPIVCSLNSCDLEESPLYDHVDENYDGVCNVCGREEEYVFVLNYDKTGYKLSDIGPAYKGGDVVIPSTYRGLPVVELEMYAFAGAKNNLTSVTIPASVKEIGVKAFAEQDNLETVIINGSTIIDVQAFYLCPNLKTVVINEGTEYIYAGAFSMCFSLESVTIADTVTKILGEAFANCTKLKAITIPASVEIIGESCFVGSGFTDIYFEMSAPGESWDENWDEGLYADEEIGRDEDVNLHWAEAEE